MSTKQTRIFLWTLPRSVSTAFFRAMTNRKSIKVLMEPYARGFYLGPDRVSTRYEAVPVSEEDTYDNIRALCEQPYPGVDEVFVKDFACFVVCQPDYRSLLPAGYTHTFLIRHPAKSIPSFYRASTNKGLTGSDRYEPRGSSVQDLYQLLELVTTELGQEAIIVDADDLLAHPEDVLRQYCTRVGVDFQQGMIDWEDDPQTSVICKDWPAGWFTHVLNSRTFEPSTDKLPSNLAMSELPEEVQKAINDGLPYYDKMYALRIKPTSTTV